jgi:hypothetical protein
LRIITAVKLAEHQPPVSRPAEGVLLRLRGEVDGHLDVVEGAKLVVAEDAQRVAVRGDAGGDALCLQVVHDGVKLGVQPVLARAEVGRAHRQALADAPHVGEGQVLRGADVAVAVRAAQIASVREP